MYPEAGKFSSILLDLSSSTRTDNPDNTVSYECPEYPNLLSNNLIGNAMFGINKDNLLYKSNNIFVRSPGPILYSKNFMKVPCVSGLPKAFGYTPGINGNSSASKNNI